MRSDRPSGTESTRTTLRALVRIPGGARYTLSAAVESLTSGLLRPFVVIYAVTIGLDPLPAGVALTAGMLVGLVAVPLAGRWIDTGALRAPSIAALLVRATGAGCLVLFHGVAGFAIGAVLIGVGTQVAPPANNALVAALAGVRHRAAALAAARSIRNAGLGAGALLATALVAGGPGVIGRLSLGMAAGCALGAAVLATVPVRRADAPAVARPGAERPPVGTGAARGGLRTVTVLALAGIPFAFYADVLEIALPVTLVQTLRASPAWSSGIFVGNTVLVIALQVIVVVRLSRRSNRAVLAVSGLVLAGSYLGFWLGAAHGGLAGIMLIAAAAVPYTIGEILYTGSSVPLVIESAPPHLIGRALARWQLGYGLARAADPVIITGLLSIGATALWVPLAAATLLGAAAVAMSGRINGQSR
jgi:MFS family permease